MKEESEKLRAVFDTNVLLSMLGFPGGRLDALWRVILEEKIDLFLSDFILEEFRKNLRLKARFEQKEAGEAVALLKRHARIVLPAKRVNVIREKEADNRILECAVEARARVLVTGNFKHIRPLVSFRNIEILTPREFLDKYFPHL